MCAVFGGIYCLHRQVAAAVLDDSSRSVHVRGLQFAALVHFVIDCSFVQKFFSYFTDILVS